MHWVVGSPLAKRGPSLCLAGPGWDDLISQFPKHVKHVPFGKYISCIQIAILAQGVVALIKVRILKPTHPPRVAMTLARVDKTGGRGMETIAQRCQLPTVACGIHATLDGS